MQKYINAHCHINTPTDNKTGVVGAIYNSAKMSDWETIKAIAHTNNHAHACIGIHPWHINTATPDWEKQMEPILTQNPKFMVGEIGLDKNYPNMPMQIEFFCRQMEIAKKQNRTAHIHCVGAWDKILHLLGANAPRMVMHAFNGTPEIIKSLARKYDVYFSFSPVILDARRTRIHKSVMVAPENRILIESDDMPMDVLPALAQCIANIRKTPNDKMTEILYNNTMQMLG